MWRAAALYLGLVSAILIPEQVGIAQSQPPRSVNPDPARALWLAIKRQLLSSEGEQYFEKLLKNADAPLLSGTLVSASPEEQPNTLVLRMPEGAGPEVTLRLQDDHGRDSHLNGRLMPGSQIQFEGIPSAFTREPFMLTFDVPLSPRTVHATMPQIAPRNTR